MRQTYSKYYPLNTHKYSIISRLKMSRAKTSDIRNSAKLGFSPHYLVPATSNNNYQKRFYHHCSHTSTKLFWWEITAGLDDWSHVQGQKRILLILHMGHHHLRLHHTIGTNMWHRHLHHRIQITIQTRIQVMESLPTMVPMIIPTIIAMLFMFHWLGSFW